jgi:hypothetical protein
MVRSKSSVKYYAKQIKHIIMRKDVVYLEMIWCNDIMSLNTSDEGYNNGKKCGQKGAICGPNSHWLLYVYFVVNNVYGMNIEYVVFLHLGFQGKNVCVMCVFSIVSFIFFY